MNDDECENKLRALTGARRRPDSIPAWKADILARARREAKAGTIALPPRWLALSWAAAWAVILLMNFTTPRNPALRASHEPAEEKTESKSVASLPRQSSALFAFHQRMNLDFPP